MATSTRPVDRHGSPLRYLGTRSDEFGFLEPVNEVVDGIGRL